MHVITTFLLGLLASLSWSAVLPGTSLHTRQATGGAQVFPQINMTDTSGNAIQAHGGAIIQVSDQFYWFGEDKAGETTSGHFQAVNCYRSPDLATWEFAGAVLEPIAGSNISTDNIVERPKVLYNKKNDEYVMWFHGDSSNYGAAQVGVATSKTVDGKYTWKGNFKPFNTDSRDMTVWKDPDNEDAYLIFASDGNANFKIASLDDDYYNVSEQLFIWESVFWEAPGVLKVDGTFHLLYSRQDGWTPTDNYYMTSTSMSGPWSDPTLLTAEGFFAYNTQNAYEITLTGTGGTTYLYLGDHWNAPNLGSSTYAMYPLKLDGSGLSISYTTGYSLDAQAGTWTNLEATTIDTAQLSLPEGSETVACSSCESGQAVDLTASAQFTFEWSGSAGDKVLVFHYTYPAGKQEWKHLLVSVDGEDQGSALLESSRNVNNYFDAPMRAAKLTTGSTVEVKLPNNSGATVLVTSVDVYDVAT